MGPTGNTSYFAATRHPWSSLVFVLPLLATYEVGVLWLASAQPEALRNGADTWLRWALDGFGLHQLYWAPAILAFFLMLWGWTRRRDRPADLVSLWIGMTVESVVLALGLWGISRGMVPLLDRLGIQLQVTGPPSPAQCPEEAFECFISFLGAGIYEEVLFRLLLFSGLIWLFCYAAMSRRLALLLAALVSASVFSLAHHLGPYAERFNNYVFLFRTIAGMYFTFIFQTRGFGICVGTHAFYDILVGVLIPGR